MNNDHLAITIILSALLAALPGYAAAWGSGHDDVARAIEERLPEWIRARLKPADVVMFIKYSHYPDSFEPIEVALVGEAGLARLAAQGVAKRYDLHSDRGRGAAFIELVHALRDDDAGRSAFWISVLSHSTADMAACNHDPLIHQVICDWAKERKLQDRSGVELARVLPLLDLAFLRDDPADREALRQAITAQLLPDPGIDGQAYLQELMHYGLDGSAWCAARGHAVLGGAIGRLAGDAEATLRHRHALADLGAWAVVRTLRDLAVATRLARADQVPLLDQAAMNLYQTGFDARTRAAVLADEPLFAPLLRQPVAGAIGVVLEPTWRMEQAVLGFPDRVLGAAICRSLAAAGTAYATFDVRTLLSTGAPDPTLVPTLVICASGTNTVGWMRPRDLLRALAGYRAAGGRVLWIGGHNKPPDELGPFAAAAQRAPGKDPLPLANDAIPGATLSLDGGASWTGARRIIANEGWQKAVCPWFFTTPPAGGLRPLLTLRGAETAFLVGVLHPGSGPADPPAAWLPVWALVPAVFTAGQAIDTLSPQLDQAGAAILVETLGRLGGKASGR